MMRLRGLCALALAALAALAGWLGGGGRASVVAAAAAGSGSFLALAGRDSVVLATDSRVAHHRAGALKLGSQPRDVYRVGMNTLMGFHGLDSDAEDLAEALKAQLCDHVAAELNPAAIARALSNLLYEKEYLVNPVVAGIDDATGAAFLCSLDSLGASTTSQTFVVAGTAQGQLHALCESFYMPGLSANELVQLVERCLRLAFQRDILSGGDVLKIVVLHKDDIFVKEVPFQDV